MSRYTDANCKLCRREGQKLFLKGESVRSKKEITLLDSTDRTERNSPNTATS